MGIAPDPQLDWEMTLGGRFLWKNHVQSAKILRRVCFIMLACFHACDNNPLFAPQPTPYKAAQLTTAAPGAAGRARH